MRVETVSSAAGVAALEEDWDRVHAVAGAPYYVRHRVVHAWCAAYEDDPAVELRVLVVRHNQDVVALAPLALRRRVSGGRTVVWASHGDYLDVVVDPGAPVDAACKALVAHLLAEEADAVSLGNLPQGSPLLHWLLRSEHNPDVQPHVENPRIELGRYADLADLEARGLPAKTRKYRNKLYREQDLTFGVLPQTGAALLERMAAVHLAEKEHLLARGRAERRSLFDEPRRVAHLLPLFERPGEQVTFGYESPDGRLLGYRSCFRDGTTLLSWNSAYAPELEDYRLGKVMQYDILAHLMDEGGVEVFDLGAGRYPWKFEWTPAFTVTYRWQRRPPTTGGRPAQRRGKGSGKPAPATTGPPPGAIVVEPAAPLTPARVARETVRGPLRLARAARRSVGRLTAAPVVYYVPHPDDETIFMGASIARTARERPVVVVSLTRGAASSARGKLSRRLGEELAVGAFTDARGAEMRAALHRLGVPRRRVHWYDLPDGAVEHDAVLSVISEMARRHPGASHRTMSYLDPHPDHRTAGTALRTAYRDGVVTDALFHLPVSLVPDRWGTRVRLSAPDLRAKRAALREYQVWNPGAGRLAVGQTSVRDLVEGQLAAPVERTHGPDFEP